MVSLWNNVWINTPICHIIPSTNSTKIKIYSPVELEIWDKLIFNFNGDDFEVIIENVLVYKDPITQNYIYDSNYLDKNYFKDWEILSLNFDKEEIIETKIDDKLEENKKELKNIKIPVSYVKNKIDWNFVKINFGSWIIEVKVELWEINWDFIEIKNWLEEVNEVCR
jgi:hypothetical protein